MEGFNFCPTYIATNPELLCLHSLTGRPLLTKDKMDIASTCPHKMSTGPPAMLTSNASVSADGHESKLALYLEGL